VVKPSTAFKAPKCDAGHDLLICMCPVGAQICDRCRKHIQYTYSHRCRECDFDLCRRCFSGASRPPAPAPRTARGLQRAASVEPTSTEAECATDLLARTAPVPPTSLPAPSRGRRRLRQVQGVYRGFVLCPGLSPADNASWGLTQLSPQRLTGDAGTTSELSRSLPVALPRSPSPRTARAATSLQAAIVGSARTESPGAASARATSARIMRDAFALGDEQASWPPVLPPAPDFQSLSVEEKSCVATAVLVARSMAHPAMPQQYVRKPVMRPGTCLADYPSRAKYERSQW